MQWIERLSRDEARFLESQCSVLAQVVPGVVLERVNPKDVGQGAVGQEEEGGTAWVIKAGAASLSVSPEKD